jgi:hypothetical protein
LGGAWDTVYGKEHEHYQQQVRFDSQIRDRDSIDEACLQNGNNNHQHSKP